MTLFSRLTRDDRATRAKIAEHYKDAKPYTEAELRGSGRRWRLKVRLMAWRLMLQDKIERNFAFLRLKVLIGKCGDPYLVRLELIKLFGWSLKLHVFLRGDEDVEMHDHPWDFWSLVLAGRYVEEYISPMGFKTARERKAGDLSFMRATHRHRVSLTGFPTVHCATLVLCSPPRREWGFWMEEKFVDWRHFVSSREC